MLEPPNIRTFTGRVRPITVKATCRGFGQHLSAAAVTGSENGVEAKGKVASKMAISYGRSHFHHHLVVASTSPNPEVLRDSCVVMVGGNVFLLQK